MWKSNMCRGNSASISTDYKLDRRCSIPSKSNNISLPYSDQTGSIAHPVSYPVIIGIYFPRVKRPGSEADDSLPSSSEVKICGAIRWLLLHVFIL
jgi:hypothetical protein